MLEISLQGKKVLVTGASKGIGKAICFKVASANAAEVFGLARNTELLNQLQADLHKQDTVFHSVVGDLKSTETIPTIVSQLPELDAVVLNAGIAEFLPTRFSSTTKLSNTFDLNFNANVLLLSELLKKRKLKSGGSVVLISSISSKLGVAGTGLYAASKAALTAYGMVLATELAPQKIRVNSILPGLVSTDLVDGNETLTEDIVKKNESQYPLGLGKPEDVAHLTCFLLSDLSSWMTGSELVIDGGHLL